MTDKVKLIKTIYIYLVSFVALMMLVISCADIINQTLRAFVFTKADNYGSYAKPAGCGINTPRTVADKKQMTAEECIKMEKANMAREKENKIANRHRDFAKDISLIIVGLPLFYFHWRIARRKS